MARPNQKKTARFRFEMGIGGLIALSVSCVCILLWIFILGFWVGQKVSGKAASSQVQAPIAYQQKEAQPTELIEQQTEASIPSSVQERATQNEGVELAHEQETKVEEGIAPTHEKVREEPIGPSPKEGEPLEQKAQPEKEIKTASIKPTTRSHTQKHELKPARAPSPKSHMTYFVLQIASYKDRARAEREASFWSRRGYTVQVKRVDLGEKKGVWYRVYLGRFGTISSAKAFAKKVADKEGLKSYIVPVKD